MADKRKTIGDLPYIGGPAADALELEGHTTLKQLSQLSEQDLLKIHGVGPKAVRILKEAMAANGLSFSTFPKLPAPAQRALDAAGYTTLEKLSKVSEAELSELHGMGPKAIGILKAAMAARGLAFKK